MYYKGVEQTTPLYRKEFIMDIQTLADFITTTGFPCSMCIVLILYIKDRDSKLQESFDKMTESFEKLSAQFSILRGNDK